MEETRIAIVGCGGFAGAHVRRLSTIPGTLIVGLCDSSPTQLQSFAERHFPNTESPPPFDDIVDLIDTCAPDGVILCTPHTLHFQQALTALERGCHVLVEKPMVTNADDARKLVETVEATGLSLVVGYNTPCALPIQRIRTMIGNEELGRFEMASGWLSQDWLRLTKGAWRQDPALSGGGQLMDSGAHLFASVVFSINQEPKRVFAVIDNLGSQVDINGIVTIEFSSGATASISIAGDCANDGAGLSFLFEDGRVEADGWGGAWMKVWRRGTNEVEEYQPSEYRSPNHNFIACIRGEEKPIADAKLGLRIAELMDAVYRSAATNLPVEL